MDKRTFSYIFIGAFIFMAWYLYSNNDSIASIISQNGFNGVFWYFASNFSYILILVSVFALNREVGLIKNLVGSIFLIVAIDILSFPRFSPVGLTKEVMLLASNDGIVMSKLLALGLEYSTAYTFYYLVLPIALILGSVSILGITDFFKRLVKGH